MAIREFKGNAAQTTLVSGINASALSFDISDPTGWPTGGVNGKFYATIDKDEPSEETVLCLSRSGSTITIDTGDRGQDDTAAASHSSGATVIHSFTATDAREANEHINNPALDHHTQYMRADGTRHDLTARHSAGTVVPTAVPVAIGTSIAEGSGTAAARANHVHVIGTGAINLSNMFAAGVVNNAALGALSVASGNIQNGAAGTLQIADTAITPAKINATLYGTQTQPVGAAIAQGDSVTFARSNHVHSSPYDDVVRLEGGGATMTTSMANQFGASQITLAAGTWELGAIVRANMSLADRRTITARIRNVTDGADVDSKDSAFDAAATDNSGTWPLIGWVTIASTKSFELQAQTSALGGTQFTSGCKFWAKQIATLS